MYNGKVEEIRAKATAGNWSDVGWDEPVEEVQQWITYIDKWCDGDPQMVIDQQIANLVMWLTGDEEQTIRRSQIDLTVNLLARLQSMRDRLYTTTTTS